MSRRCLSVVLAWAIVPAFVFPAAAVAGHPFHFPWSRASHVPWNQASEPRFYPEYVVDYDLYAPGLGVPTYSWGNFGARHGSSCGRHTGYYNDSPQWKCSRGP
ncbi:MAG: hypothetical protein HQ582_16430 [Planctomycetes bacterium]|nr:hypothetical protein [Planctomycetota bacterium]